jgi:hypothetical protein
VQTSGCPAIPATATTAAIPATPGIQARLSLSPDPTCTGVRTFFDMSGSTTPNPPITDYRLTYQVLPYPAYLSIILGTGLEAVGFGLLGGGTQLLESNVVETAVDRFLATQPSAGLYESPESSHAFDFTWNRAIKGSPYQKFETGPVVRADINGYARDPLVVTLTVRDRTGASSRVTRFLEFAQVYSAGHLGVSRTGCPKVKVLAHVPAYAFDKLSVASLSAQTIAVKIPCATSSPCAGNFSAYRIAANTATATAASAAHAAKSTPVLIARSDFFTVPGKSSATIRATLTKAGQALARRHEPVPASVRVTSVSSATGRQATHSTRITLPYKKSK